MKLKEIVLMMLFAFTVGVKGFAQPTEQDGGNVSDDYKHPLNKVSYKKIALKTDTLSIDDNYKNQTNRLKSKRKALVVKVNKPSAAEPVQNYKHQVPLKRQ
jgi:hypothetical protein